MRRKVTFRLPDGAAPAAITVRHAGRIVAHDRLRPAATFELPGDSTYEIELRRDGQPASTRSVKLNADPEQVVTLESPR